MRTYGLAPLQHEGVKHLATVRLALGRNVYLNETIYFRLADDDAHGIQPNYMNLAVKLGYMLPFAVYLKSTPTINGFMVYKPFKI